MLQIVQRTLIVTSGTLAVQAGRALQEMVEKWQGPAAAVSVVEVTEEILPPSTNLTAVIQEALACISSTAMVTELAEQGYTLDRVQEIALFLLMDTSPVAGEQAVQLAQQVAAVVEEHLGIETSPLLIWLATEPIGEATAACLNISEANRLLFSRGILALGSLNEAGLRLPDEAGLVTHCAEALWLLVAAPLRTALEWLTAQDGEPALATLGVGRWDWSIEAMRHALQRRWLLEVIDQWLSPTSAVINASEVAHWLTTADLLTPSPPHPLTLSPPHPVTPSPWPWQWPALFEQMAAEDAADQEGEEQRAEAVGIYMDEFLQVANQCIEQQLKTLIDQRPVGGVAYTCQWIAMLSRELRQLRDGLLQEAEKQQPADEALCVAKEELDTRLNQLLDAWPPSTLFAWVWMMLKPWKWPGLGWHYWQLHSLAQQLALVYHHQARRRRQQMVMQATIQAYAQLERIAARCMGQVEEIGDMLGYLRGRIEERLEIRRLETGRLEMVDALYGRLTDDPLLEAEMAAAAVGGLGQQAIRLDDDQLWAGLQHCVAERLAGLDDCSAVRLLQLLHPSADELVRWWQRFWETAAPLWRHDAARLPERVRNQEMDMTYLCGTDATTLFEGDGDTLPPEMQCVESADRQRLFLLRLRAGLTARAMTR